MLFVDIKKKLSQFNLSISFDISNEIVVLFGPSGSGKTTILNCIAGTTHPDEGHIHFNGRTFFRTATKPMPIQARNVGYLFQDYALFPHMTVQKNILYGMKGTNPQKEKLLQTVGEELRITHLFSKFPSQISGGEKQRVALARALSCEPDILVLDEPFSALDHEHKSKAHDELLRLHHLWKIPVILVTHDLEEAKKLADRILFIKQGLFVKEHSI